MNATSSGKDPTENHSTSRSRHSPGLISPDNSCISTTISGQTFSSTKVPIPGDIPNITTAFERKTATNPFDEEPDVIELPNRDKVNSSKYNAVTKCTSSESQFSILASCSTLNNNQTSNESSATKVPNIKTSNTSTKVPIATCSSILSTTLLSAAKASVNVPICNESSTALYGNNNVLNNAPSDKFTTSQKDQNQTKNTQNSLINTFDKMSSGKSLPERLEHNSKVFMSFDTHYYLKNVFSAHFYVIPLYNRQ